MTSSSNSALRPDLRAALDAFLETPLHAELARCLSVDADENALALFRRVAQSVPAYRAFLADAGVDPAAVRTPQDFARLPLVTRDGYLRRYPLADRCRAGSLTSCDMIAFSSGSTGEPTLWPRFVTDELAVAFRFEQVFVDAFEADRKTTLAVVCFPLGTWVGGMYTASACRHLATKGHPIVVVTPGNNRDEILRVVNALGGDFEQVVLLGYPPFMKDVIDTGLARGHAWSRTPIKLVLAGEVFSEEWRALVCERLGGVEPTTSTASLYGTADAGVLGNETPLSIAIRRFLADRPDAARESFGESRLPTLVQYDPLRRFFEVNEGTLLFSGDGGVPLVRYHISDQGGLFEYGDLLARLADFGFDADAAIARTGRPARRLPFVYVFGRSHFTISYFGANIYPENVAVGLERGTIARAVTGKFVLESKEDADRNRTLALAIELAPDASPSDDLREAIAASVVTELLRVNSEFGAYVPAANRKPIVDLRPHGDPAYFPIGVKHRYTRRSD